MISAALFVFGVLACFQNGDSAMTWTTPVASTATTSASLTPSVAEQGGTSGAVKTLTGLTVVAASVTPTQTIQSYSIMQNSYSIFAISLAADKSGQLELAADMALDYEFLSSHILVIEAIDDSSTVLTGTLTATIVITDVTTSDPVWPSLYYCTTITSPAAAATSLTTITASGTSVTYSISPDTTFSIGTSTGLISVKTGVTAYRAVNAVHQLAVTAIEGTQTSSTLVIACVGATECSSFCSSGSGAAATTINIMAIFSMFLLLVL